MNELYAVLVATPGGDSLILPKTAVQEVLSTEALESGGRTAWIAGRAAWGGGSLPVVDWDACNGGVASELTRRTRVAVLNGISGRLAGGRFALLTQGHPHLVTLTPGALQPAPLLDDDRAEYLLTRVRIANATAAIPDLDSLEGAIAEQVPGAAAD